MTDIILTLHLIMTFVCRNVARDGIERVATYVVLVFKCCYKRYTHYMYMTDPSCYPTASVRLGMGHCFVKLGKMDKAR